MRIKSISPSIITVQFKSTFRHSRKSRGLSKNIFTKCLLEDGTCGYGEGIPREYVTGETPGSSIIAVKSLARSFQGKDFSSMRQIVRFLSDMRVRKNQLASMCSIELALLDAYGKHFKVPISDVIGLKREYVRYSAVISADSIEKLSKLCWLIRLFGIKDVKLKVGLPNDAERLEFIRRKLGKDINLREDANRAWTLNGYLSMSEVLQKYSVSAIEDPLKDMSIRNLKKAKKLVHIPIIVDEVLCTIKEAKQLANARACDYFNIRLSKCGGLLNSFKIHKVGKRAGIKSILGAHVGETGILSSAGRHFALSVPDLAYVEGSYDRFLLKENTIKGNVGFGFGGKGKRIKGYGLGIVIRDKFR